MRHLLRRLSLRHLDDAARFNVDDFAAAFIRLEGDIILAEPKVLVGFAAETEHLMENAARKLERKNLDMIVHQVYLLMTGKVSPLD